MGPTKENVGDKIIELEEEKEILLRPKEVEKLLKQKEREVKQAADDLMKREIDFLRQRCDFILQNEQVRASYMLREAHRERQEKIAALQTQLECKNLAGLMFVMCSERKKSKLELRKLSEEYTTYILTLQAILTDAQQLILNLSRGYKTAARVDDEWRTKMKNVITEFQTFVNNYIGGNPEANQYFFDLPKLLKTETPTKDNPQEDPCEVEEEEEIVADITETEKPWWERMGDDSRPFVVFGDMSEFKVPERREVLNKIKAKKTAPKKWKEYIFHHMFLSSECNNEDEDNDQFQTQIPDEHWECSGPTTKTDMSSRVSLATSRRGTSSRVSEDIRVNMGSILKIISAGQPTHNEQTAILGARDSMEIASTTKLRTTEGRTRSQERTNGKVIIQVGGRRQSIFDEELETVNDAMNKTGALLKDKKADIEEDDEVSISKMTVKKTDSKEVISHHKPDVDHKINYEKVCPVAKCQRLKVDSFTRALPLYMRANPFTHFEQHFDEYETCSPEQLAILSQRIADRKGHLEQEASLNEWTPSVDGIAVQTSDISMTLPPCTCRDPFNTPASSRGIVYDVTNLITVKKNLDTVNQECLYDDDIEFNRFKVIGEDESSRTFNKSADIQDRNRVQEITQILKQHPSFLDIFQGNAHCL